MSSPQHDTLRPPALLIGGAENAVSAARALLRRGVEVVVLAEDGAPAHRARGVRAETLGRVVDHESLSSWFSDRSAPWNGAVVIPLSDPVLTYLAGNYESVNSRFRIVRMDPGVVTDMLDKQRTVELAADAGVPAPRQWAVTSTADLEVLLEEVAFPVLVKPRSTYEFVRRSGRKFLWARDREGLHDATAAMADLPGGYTVLEFVPGPDSRLCSYYAVRHDGQILGEFTKRVERRYPTNEGGGTLHKMCDDEQAKVLGRRLFAHIGLEGIGNVEFKLDVRDGQLKLIECNHRLTAATELIQRSGIDVVGAVYQQAIGKPERFAGPSRMRWLWYPGNDLLSAARLSPRATADWLSVPLRRPVLPYWRLGDPAPSLQHSLNWLRGFIARRRAAPVPR